MKTYDVEIDFVVTFHGVTIEADNAEEARKIARRIVLGWSEGTAIDVGGEPHWRDVTIGEALPRWQLR